MGARVRFEIFREDTVPSDVDGLRAVFLDRDLILVRRVVQSLVCVKPEDVGEQILTVGGAIQRRRENPATRSI